MCLAIQRPNVPGSKPSDVQQVNDWESRVTLDIIGLASMGRDFNTVKDPNNEQSGRSRMWLAIGLLIREYTSLGYILPQPNNAMAKAAKVIRRVCRDLVMEKKAKLEKGSRTDVDILSVAMESGGFTDEDLVNQMMTFLAAGHETTSSALTLACYCLCKHPDVQTRLREEIRSSLDPNANISSANIDRLKYLNAVIKEFLRCLPSVPVSGRTTVRDTTILGHHIPQGTQVIMAPTAVNSSKELWGEDALEFNPDRWMGAGKSNIGSADSNYAFLTFMHGPRSCIGKDFSKAEFACLLAAWAGRFEMELEDQNYVLDPIKGTVTIRLRTGLEVRLKELEGW